MVYSITSRESFDELASFRDHILRVKDTDKVPMVVVGNKSDVAEKERRVRGMRRPSTHVCMDWTDTMFFGWFQDHIGVAPPLVNAESERIIRL